MLNTNSNWSEIKAAYEQEFVKPVFYAETLATANFFDLLPQTSELGNYLPEWTILENIASIKFYESQTKAKSATITITVDDTYYFDFLNNVFLLKNPANGDYEIRAIGKEFFIRLYYGANINGVDKLAPRFTGVIKELSVSRKDRNTRTMTIIAEDFSYIFKKQLMYNYPDLHSYQTADYDEDKMPNKDVENSNLIVPAYDNWRIKDVIKDLCRKVGFPIGMLTGDILSAAFRLDHGEMYPFLMKKRDIINANVDKSSLVNSDSQNGVIDILDVDSVEGQNIKNYSGINVDALKNSLWQPSFGEKIWDYILKIVDLVGYTVYFDEYGFLTINKRSSYTHEDTYYFAEENKGAEEIQAIHDDIYGWNVLKYTAQDGRKKIVDAKPLTMYGFSIPPSKFLFNWNTDPYVYATGVQYDSFEAGAERDVYGSRRLCQSFYIESIASITRISVVAKSKDPLNAPAEGLYLALYVADEYGAPFGNAIAGGYADAQYGLDFTTAQLTFDLPVSVNPKSRYCIEMRSPLSTLANSWVVRCSVDDYHVGYGSFFSDDSGTTWFEESHYIPFQKILANEISIYAKPTTDMIQTADWYEASNNVYIDVYRKKTSESVYALVYENIPITYNRDTGTKFVVERDLEFDTYDVAIKVVGTKTFLIDSIFYTAKDTFSAVGDFRSSVNLSSIDVKYSTENIRNDITVLGNLSQYKPLKYRSIDETSIYGGDSMKMKGFVKSITFMDSNRNILSQLDGNVSIDNQSAEIVEILLTEPKSIKNAILYMGDVNGWLEQSDHSGWIKVFWQSDATQQYSDSYSKTVKFDADYKANIYFTSENKTSDTGTTVAKIEFHFFHDETPPIEPRPKQLPLEQGNYILMRMYDYDIFNKNSATNIAKFANQMIVHDEKLNMNRKVKWLSRYLIEKYRRYISTINVSGFGNPAYEVDDAVNVIDGTIGLTGAYKFWITEYEDTITHDNYVVNRIGLTSLPPIESYEPYPQVPDPYKIKAFYLTFSVKDDYKKYILSNDLKNHIYYDENSKEVLLVSYRYDKGYYDVYSTDVHVNVITSDDTYFTANVENASTSAKIASIVFPLKLDAGIYNNSEFLWDCGIDFKMIYGPLVNKALMPNMIARIAGKFYSKLDRYGNPLSPKNMSYDIPMGTDKVFRLDRINVDKTSFKQGEQVNADVVFSFKELEDGGQSNVVDFIELPTQLGWVYNKTSVYGVNEVLYDMVNTGDFQAKRMSMLYFIDHIDDISQLPQSPEFGFNIDGRINDVYDAQIQNLHIRNINGHKTYFIFTVTVPTTFEQTEAKLFKVFIGFNEKIANNSSMKLYYSQSWSGNNDWVLLHNAWSEGENDGIIYNQNIIPTNSNSVVPIAQSTGASFGGVPSSNNDISTQLTQNNGVFVNDALFTQGSNISIDAPKIPVDYGITIKRFAIELSIPLNTNDLILSKVNLYTRGIVNDLLIIEGNLSPSSGLIWDGINAQGVYSKDGLYYFKTDEVMTLQLSQYFTAKMDTGNGSKNDPFVLQTIDSKQSEFVTFLNE